MDNKTCHCGSWHCQELLGHCWDGLCREGCLEGNKGSKDLTRSVSAVKVDIDKDYIIKPASLYMCGCMVLSEHSCICGINESLPKNTIGVGGEVAP